MKKRIIFLLSCFLVAACNGQQNVPAISNNVGFGMTGYSTRYPKLDSHARDVLQDYLQDEYDDNCKGRKHPSKSCVQDRPYLTSGSLPVGVKSHALPADVVSEVGFTPPGTDLVQVGYNIYLIHFPNNIIYDSVSLHPYWKESLRK
jgi:hypothetical protein